MAVVSLEEFKRLKTKVENAKREADRAEGAYEAAMKRLGELGFEDVEHANARLAELRDELNTAEEEYQNKLDEFNEKWEEKLA